MTRLTRKRNMKNYLLIVVHAYTLRLYLHNSDIKEMPGILRDQESGRCLIRNASVGPAYVECDRAGYSHSQARTLQPHHPTVTKKHQSALTFRVSQQTSVRGLLEGRPATFIWTLNDTRM